MKWVRLLLIATACGAAITSPPALAAAGSTSPLGYAVTAQGFRSYFVFDTRPGGTVRGALRVVDLNRETKTIVLGPVDVSTAAAGGLQYGNSSPHQEGRWITLSRHSMRLSGNRPSADIPFTVRVPPSAQPGDHFLGIVAVDHRVLDRHVAGHGHIRLRLIPRLAMTVELRLPSRSIRALALGSIQLDVAPSGASLAFLLSNPGNRLIGATTGHVTVSQSRTVLFSRRIDLAAFVPKTTITYHAPWAGTPVQGSYRVKGELRPAGASPIRFDRTVTFDRGAIRKFRQQTGRAAHEAPGTPVALIVFLALALAAAVVFAVAYARARRQLRTAAD